MILICTGMDGVLCTFRSAGYTIRAARPLLACIQLPSSHAIAHTRTSQKDTTQELFHHRFALDSGAQGVQSRRALH